MKEATRAMMKSCERDYHVYTMFIEPWMLGHAVKELDAMLGQMRLLGHAVKEATMFIEPWMRLLGHAVKEATMFIEPWMRLLGHAVRLLELPCL